MTKGVYVLVILVRKAVRPRVGHLGEVSFSSGQYLYVGSAMGTGSTSVENRLRRHFSDRKTKRWHIDYFLGGGGRAVSAVWAATDRKLECDLVRRLESHPSMLPYATGFGCSDCRGSCRTHLFRFAGPDSVISTLKELVLGLGLKARVTASRDLRTCSP